MLVGLEQRSAHALADEPVLVVDEQRLAAASAPKPRQQGQLRPEDERIVEMDDVEALDPRQPRDQRRVADREDRIDAVDDRAAGIGLDRPAPAP